MSTAGWGAASSMMVTAFAGPDPEVLWAAYLAAGSGADTKILDWGETVIAGGRGWQSGRASVAMYQALEAQRAAYAAYVAARNMWLGRR